MMTYITDHPIPLFISHKNACDIKAAHIDKSLPPSERIKAFLSEGYDPYRFHIDNTVINIRFNEERSLACCLSRAFDAAVS